MFKKLLSAVLSVVTVTGVIPQIPVKAEETVRYPYTMFAGSAEEGAITFNSNNVCINGNIATNGTISATAQNFNVNGAKTENAQEKMKLFFNKIDGRYFTSDVDTYFEDYFLEDTNINVNTPIEAKGDIGLTGNINITSGIKALKDVVLDGNVENSQDSVICSETGDIIINTGNVNLNGLIYAPYGCVNITAQNLNINSVIIIADKITINCPNLNANYNSQVAEFLGNESAPIVNGDLEIVAYGEYDEENEVFSVYWNTDEPEGSFDIQASDDGESFTSIGTVTDADSFECTFTEPFEKKYIKVVETTNKGEICESVPFVFISTEDGYDSEDLDSDEDGIPDIYELEIGTDPQNADTDDDGLTDYQEYVGTKTDPLVYDSVIEGVSDADIDTDEDGLSNIDEFTRETYPWDPDTDKDGLNDYDEIFVYGTDPLVADSDKDGLDDGSEIKLGLDPNDPSTHGTPDSEYPVKQSLKADSSVFKFVNTEKSPYELSIDIKTNGDAEKALTVYESGYATSIENDAMIGASVEINIADTCKPEEIVLNYRINEDYISNDPDSDSSKDNFKGIKRLAVFRYFDDVNALLPLDTEYDESTNTISARVEDGGSYFIIDTEKWFASIGIDLDEIDEAAPVQPLRMNSPKALADETSDKSGSSNQKKGKGAYGYLFEDSPVDLIFMLQKSGSGSEKQIENFEFEKKLIHDISAYAFKNYGDVWIHIVPYGFTTGDPIEINDGWPIEKSLDEVDYVLSNVEYMSFGTPAYRNIGYLQTVKNLLQSYRERSKKYVISLTNGTTNFVNVTYDGYNFTQDCEWVYVYFWQNDITFSEVISNGNNFDPYLHEYLSGNVSDLTDPAMIKKVLDNRGLDLTLDTSTNNNYTDLINSINEHASRKSLYGAYSSVDWNPVVLSGELNSENGIDTDGDCLTDWEETDVSQLKMYDDGSFDLPTVQDVINKIKSDYYREQIKKFIENKLSVFDKSQKSKAEDSFYKKGVISYKSDLIKQDSDGDGYTDLEDPAPMKTPEILGKKYDFLDTEIYYLRAIETSTIDPSLGDFSNKDYISMKNGADTPGTSVVLDALDTQKDDFKFRFEWCGDGYKIHSLLNDSLVLTADITSQTATMQLDRNYTRQKWEVLPYKSDKYLWGTNGFDGIIFRCKECVKSDKNDKRFIPLYLNYGNGSLTISTERNNNVCFVPYANNIGQAYSWLYTLGMNIKDNVALYSSKWTRFGEAYMRRCGWISYKDDSYDEEFATYADNVQYTIPSDAKDTISGKTVILNQHNKIFNDMHLAESEMYDVICEVMATRNALSLYSGYQYDLSKLAFEFEINKALTNVMIISKGKRAAFTWLYQKFVDESFTGKEVFLKGGLGSNPLSIVFCLVANNVSGRKDVSILKGSDKLHITDVESELQKNPICIASYINTNKGYIHTFCICKNLSDGKYYSVNYDCDSNTALEISSFENFLDKDETLICYYVF